jgi:hypothetical protein
MFKFGSFLIFFIFFYLRHMWYDDMAFDTRDTTSLVFHG